MVSNLNAKALLDKFGVYGHFYEKRVAGVDESLRDRLEIAPRDWLLADVIGREPELLVVMMNPGASRPLDALWDAEHNHGFVATHPDRTQYQIMRLMLAAQAQGMPWQHARVLNLSDLRTPKSAVFLEKLRAYSEDDSHSLFSNARRQECEALFRHKPTPVLLAWGLSPQFARLAQSAIDASCGHPIMGLSDDGLAYRHPLPQRHDLQLRWIKDLVSQLQYCSQPESVTTQIK